MKAIPFSSLAAALFGVALIAWSSTSNAWAQPQAPAQPEITSSSTASGKIDEMIGRRFPPMSLNKHAESADYGYSEKVPVAVGGGFSEGGHNVYRYLNALAGPQGQIIHYTRVGTCCAFKTPDARFDGTGLLEVYEVTYEGLPKPNRLYFNWYGAADPQIPVGLTTPQGPASEPPFWPCVSNYGAPFGHLTESDV